MKNAFSNGVLQMVFIKYGALLGKPGLSTYTYQFDT